MCSEQLFRRMLLDLGSAGNISLASSNMPYTSETSASSSSKVGSRTNLATDLYAANNDYAKSKISQTMARITNQLTESKQNCLQNGLAMAQKQYDRMHLQTQALEDMGVTLGAAVYILATRLVV